MSLWVSRAIYYSLSFFLSMCVCERDRETMIDLLSIYSPCFSEKKVSLSPFLERQKREGS